MKGVENGLNTSFDKMISDVKSISSFDIKDKEALVVLPTARAPSYLAKLGNIGWWPRFIPLGFGIPASHR